MNVLSYNSLIKVIDSKLEHKKYSLRQSTNTKVEIAQAYFEISAIFVMRAHAH